MERVTSPAARGPHLACSTGAFFARPLDEAFDLIAGSGFRDVEVVVTHDPATRQASRLRELSGARGLTIRAIHAPFLLMTRRVWGTDPIGKIERSVELARQTGVPVVVVHPPYRWQRSYRRWLEERIERLSGEEGVAVAVENMFPIRLAGGRTVTLHAGQEIQTWERFPHVVLDTSHAAVAGLDVVATAARLGERLAHVHLSNNAGRGWDSHLPVDEGVLPLDDLLEELASSAFAGTITLELDLRQHLGDRAALRDVLARNLDRCRSRLPLAAGGAVRGA